MGRALIAPNENKRRNLFFLVSAFLIWTYVLLRAKFLAVTWDEAWCFSVTVQNKLFFSGKFDEMAANNHYLNTVLMWLSWKMFGNGEFILRIPSLIGCAVYLFFSLKFISRIRNFPVAVFAFALLCLDPFILDFLGLARGYCLAMTFMMAALWYLFSYVKEGNRQWKLLLSLFFSALSLTANLSWTCFFIAHAAVVLLLQLHLIFVDKQRKYVISFLLALFFSAGIIFAAGWLELQFEKAGALGYGTYDGLWNGTVTTLLDGFFYRRHYAGSFQLFMRSLIIVFLLVALLSVLVYVQDNGWKKWNRSFLFILFFMFLMFIAGQEALHYIFDIKFIMGRTAFPLLLMFCLIAIFSADEILSETFRRLLIVAPTLFLLVHFCFSINLHFTFEWYKGADVKLVLAAIEKDLEQRPEPRPHNVRMACDLPFFTDIRYYDDIKHFSWMSELRFLYDKVDPDLRYFVASEETIHMLGDKPEWKMMEYYPEEGAALFYNTAYVIPHE